MRLLGVTANNVPAWGSAPITVGQPSADAVNNLADAEAVIANWQKQQWATSEMASYINYLNTGATTATHYYAGQPSPSSVADRAFPGTTIGTDVNDFVTLATGSIVIPAAGDYTFGVNSDEGFKLQIFATTTLGPKFTAAYGAGTTFSGNTLQRDGLRTAADSLGVVNFPSAGTFFVRLVTFDHTGGAEAELTAAQGALAAFDPSLFRLVGDTAHGGLQVGTTQINLNSLGVAEAVIANGGTQAWSQSEQAPYINYDDTAGNAANFYSGAAAPGNIANRVFPGLASVSQGLDDYVVEAKGVVRIPAAGNWTFDVNSDDGFGLYIDDGKGTAFAPFQYIGPKGSGDQFRTYNFPAAGDYNLRLVYFERGGGAGRTVCRPRQLHVVERQFPPGGRRARRRAGHGRSWTMTSNPNWNTKVPDFQVTTYQSDPQPGLAVDVFQSNAQTGFTVNNYKVDPQPGIQVTTTKTGMSGMSVTTFKVNTGLAVGTVDNLADALTVLANPSYVSWKQTETAPYVNYDENVGAGAHFYAGAAAPGNIANRPFPGLTIGTDTDDYVVEVNSLVHIPAAGHWTFGVNSDDGFSLDITGLGQAFHSEYAAPRGSADTLADFNFAQAGDYNLHLVYYERGGGAQLELFAAQGSWIAWFETANWRLVGDTADAGLGAPLNSGFYVTDYRPGTPGFDVQVVRSTSGPGDITAAEAILNGSNRTSTGAQNSSQWGTFYETAPYINYMNTDTEGHFVAGGAGAANVANRTVPGMVIGTDRDAYVMLATGTVYITAPGEWTFGVNSDDGFRVTIPGATFSAPTGGAVISAGNNGFEYTGGRGASDSFAVAAFPSAGEYSLRMVWFEGGGGSESELFASQGARAPGTPASAWSATRPAAAWPWPCPTAGTSPCTRGRSTRATSAMPRTSWLNPSKRIQTSGSVERPSPTSTTWGPAATATTPTTGRFPARPPAADVDGYVVQGKGTIYFPAAGDYTFGVNSDDGFRVSIPGARSAPRATRRSRPSTPATIRSSTTAGAGPAIRWPWQPFRQRVSTRSSSRGSRGAAAPRASCSPRRAPRPLGTPASAWWATAPTAASPWANRWALTSASSRPPATPATSPRPGRSLPPARHRTGSGSRSPPSSTT